MIFMITAKQKFKEQLLVAVSVRCFLMAMDKVFLISKLQQQ